MNDPLSPSLNDSSTSPMACCVELRCKSMYYRSDERPGRLHCSDTQLYWCTHTQDQLGPDGTIAAPKLCQPGRGCYRAEE